MLEGYINEWSEWTSNTEAVYTNLHEGEYVFKVKGSNGDGFWADNPKELKVVITPAWWNNIYAYFAYAFIFFGFLYGIRRFEMDRRTKINDYNRYSRYFLIKIMNL